jgi:hypothetical protein
VHLLAQLNTFLASAAVVNEPQGGAREDAGQGLPVPVDRSATRPVPETVAANTTDTKVTKKKTRMALLGGLRNGKLHMAVDKMEADLTEEPRVAVQGTAVLRTPKPYDGGSTPRQMSMPDSRPTSPMVGTTVEVNVPKSFLTELPHRA